MEGKNIGSPTGVKHGAARKFLSSRNDCQHDKAGGERKKVLKLQILERKRERERTERKREGRAKLGRIPGLRIPP